MSRPELHASPHSRDKVQRSRSFRRWHAKCSSGAGSRMPDLTTLAHGLDTKKASMSRHHRDTEGITE
jgi:hypothetical protein